MWTCGRGEYGLCGNGGTEDQLLPAPLEAFEEHIIVDVQARGEESVCFSYRYKKRLCRE